MINKIFSITLIFISFSLTINFFYERTSFNAMYLKIDEVNLGETNITTMLTRGDFQLCKFQFHQPLTLLATGGGLKCPHIRACKPHPLNYDIKNTKE